jgi:hypothetical protein
MKDKNLSNIPAPYVYVDAESLFIFTGLFRRQPKPHYNNKLITIMREVNIGMFIDTKGKISKRIMDKSPFVFTTFLKGDIPKLVKTLKTEKTFVLVAPEREGFFSWANCAVSIENSVESILNGLGC